RRATRLRYTPLSRKNRERIILIKTKIVNDSDRVYCIIHFFKRKKNSENSMTAQLIDGKAVAAALKSEMKEIIEKKVAEGAKRPGLAVILIGDDPASSIYVRNKRQACEQVGIESVHHHLPANISEEDLLKLIQTLNEAENIDGILLQLPLPHHIDEDKII